jgi:uncharacterized protein (UPF0335 family)
MSATDLDELESELGVSSGQLRQYIEKIEKLEEEKSELQEHVKEAFAQAKNDGFDVKIMRKILAMRKMKKEELMEQQELLEIYAKALGMVI